MNTYVQKQLVRSRAPRIAVVITLMSSLLAGIPSSSFAAESKESRFQSADEAAKALVQAARAHDTAALVRFLGPGSQRIVSSGDPVSDRQTRERFVQAYDEASRLESVTEAEAVLHLGKDDWPFPIPLVKDAKGWRFDVARGREEILRRRIGRNELETTQVCLAYVDAQREYAQQDWNRDGVRQYAQKFTSGPGKRDGLFWEVKADEAPSPLGPLAAKARGDGYQPGKGPAPVPFHGYLYRILKAQGSHAPGGAFSYVAKGRMIGGFALVAYPAEYRTSGVMTFIVNQDGVVYERDLGPNTAAVARRMTAFDPDPAAWKPVTPPVAGGGKVPPPAVDVLPNGLTLIVQEHRAADIVAVHLWVATGVRYESPETLGHAHFQEHMLFKGTDTFGPGHVDRTVEGTGGRSNAFTAADYTTYQVLVPSEATPTAIQLLDAMTFRSKFDPKEIDAERKVISEEARIETDTPRTALVRQLYGMVFAEHPYGRPVLGTPATMNAATQDNLKAFNRRFYTPENMALVVVGPVDARALRAVVDRTFGRRPRTGYAPLAAPSLAPLTTIVRRTVERPEQQAYLALGWQAPRLADPDSLPLDLLATILGGSESSRLATTLRDGERIVSRVTMSNTTLQLAGVLYVQAQLEAGDVDKVERRILEEIARLQREGPTEEERQLAITKAESEHAFAYETSDGVATAYGTAHTTATLDDEVRYIERLRTITREQIRDAARKYLPATAYARLAFVPRKAQ